MYLNKKQNIIIILFSVIIALFHLLSLGKWNDALGNSYTGVIQNRQYYRLVTSIFVHGSISHMWGNCISLIIIGFAYSRRHSLVQFFTVFFAGGIFANIGSIIYYAYFLHQTNIIAVGASGAVFALMGAFALYSFLKERGRDRFGALIYLAITFVAGLENFQTDNAAHFSGLLAGAIVEFFFLLHVPGMRSDAQN